MALPKLRIPTSLPPAACRATVFVALANMLLVAACATGDGGVRPSPARPADLPAAQMDGKDQAGVIGKLRFRTELGSPHRVVAAAAAGDSLCVLARWVLPSADGTASSSDGAPVHIFGAEVSHAAGISLQTGKLLWIHPLPGDAALTGVHGGTCVFDDSGITTLVDATTGETVELDGTTGGEPLDAWGIAAGRVIYGRAGPKSFTLAARDPQTAEVLWTRQYPLKERFGMPGTVLPLGASANHIYVHDFRDDAILRISAADGRAADRFDLGGPRSCGLTVSGDLAVAVCRPMNLAGPDPELGAKSVALGKALLAFTPGNATPLWRYGLVDAPPGTRAAIGGNIVTVADGGTLVALSAADGSRLWQRELTGATAVGCPPATDGKRVAICLSAEVRGAIRAALHVFDGGTGEQLGRVFPAAGEWTGHPPLLLDGSAVVSGFATHTAVFEAFQLPR